MTATTQPPLPPGTFGLPIIGETLKFFTDSDFASKRHAEFGPVFKTRLLGSPTVFIKGPEGNRFILSHENDYFQVSWPPSVEKLLGPLSLALQSGHTHTARRKLLVQAFQPRALSGYIPAMEAISDRYFQSWLSQSELTWYPQLRDYTLDIACKLLIGLDNGSQTKLGELFESWNAGLFSLPINLPWTAFGKAWSSREKLLAEIEQLIRSRQTLLQSEPNRSETDALDIMLNARDEDTGEGLSIEELKDQVLLLLFAGHETLTSAIASFCLLMAQNPEAMAKARAEQTQFAQQPLTLAAFKDMPYLDQVIKEVMRLVPPVGGGFRKVLRDCEYGGFIIPKGWSALYQINSTHSDSDVFPNPKDFDPERFSPTAEKLQPFAHLPFGGGLRECIGKEFARLEMKVFAAQLLRSYRWTLLPGQDLSMKIVPTPKPRDGLKVRFEKLMNE
ncbi:MAG: cytochrome P450 [Cyanobacteria bacterium J06573_11]